MWLSYQAAGRIGNENLRIPLFWADLALMASGLLALRFWAIRVLARFFTVDVNIQVMARECSARGEPVLNPVGDLS